MIDTRALLVAVRDALRSDPELAAELRALLGASASSGKPKPLKDCGEPIRVLRRAVQEGDLRATKIGRGYFVTDEDLAAWRASRRVKPREHKPLRKDTAAQRAIERARAGGHLRALPGGGGAR